MRKNIMMQNNFESSVKPCAETAIEWKQDFSDREANTYLFQALRAPVQNVSNLRQNGIQVNSLDH